MSRKIWAALGAACLAFACSTTEPSTETPAETPSAPAETSLRNAKLILGRTPCAGCVEAVRSALAPIDGVQSVDIAVGKKSFLVTYDSAKVTVDRMVEAINRKKDVTATVAN